MKSNINKKYYRNPDSKVFCQIIAARQRLTLFQYVYDICYLPALLYT